MNSVLSHKSIVNKFYGTFTISCNLYTFKPHLVVPKEKSTILGTAILPEAIEDMLKPKLDKLKLMAQHLSEIEKHDGLYILKNCFEIPKLIYALRTGPCFLKSNILNSYDAVIKEALQTILNLKNHAGTSVPYP